MGKDRRLRGSIGMALTVVCWTLAVCAATVTAGALMGNAVRCEGGERSWCAPHTLVFVVGAIITLALGTAGVALHKRKLTSRRRQPRMGEH